MLCFVTVGAGVAAKADADAPLRDVLAAALEANERLAEELRAENARLREELARRDAELERVNAELAVLQRLVFGRSSERARPDAPGGAGNGDDDRDRAGGGKNGRPRGPGARAGRVVAHCRRRYRRTCSCRVPATVTAPGPPKAIGKGLLANGFIAMLLTERYVAGRSQNSLVTGLARHGRRSRRRR